MTRVCQCDGVRFAPNWSAARMSHLTQVQQGGRASFLSSRGPVYGARRPKLPGPSDCRAPRAACCALTCEPSFMRQRSAMIFARSADNAMPDTPAACPSKANHPASASNPFPAAAAPGPGRPVRGVVQRSAGTGSGGEHSLGFAHQTEGPARSRGFGDRPGEVLPVRLADPPVGHAAGPGDLFPPWRAACSPPRSV